MSDGGHHCEVWLDAPLEQVRQRLGTLAHEADAAPGGGTVLRAHTATLADMAGLLALVGRPFVVHHPEELKDAAARLGALLTASALRG